jgi:gamma-glutamyltranspeptidase/glutathione hydrolase
LSYTAPTILVKNNKPVLAIGSAGGQRITPILTEVIVRLIEFKQPMQQAINQPRFMVDGKTVFLEKDIPVAEKAKLQKMGYSFEYKNIGNFYGGVQGIRIDPNVGVVDGGYDLRRGGAYKVSD